MKKKEQQAKLTKRLKKHVIKEKQLPKSIKDLLKSKETKKTFASVDHKPCVLFERIMESYITETLAILEDDKNYSEMSVREKLLSFYFVFIHQIEKDEEFLSVVFSPKQFHLMKLVKKGMRPPFVEFLGQIIQEGIINEEIKSRMTLDKFYVKILEKDLLIVLKYWLKDHSDDKAKTDELIERLVHLEMNIMGPNFMDDFIGLGKMMLENSPLAKYTNR